MLFSISILVIFSGLLVWAAYSDWRTRLIPYAAGYGLLICAIAYMISDGRGYEAAFLALAVFGSAGGLRQHLTIIAGALLYYIVGDSVVPLLLGLAVAYFMFKRSWIGGGDAQVAFALIGMSGDWQMLALLTFATFIVWVSLSLVRNGPLQALRRLVYVARHLGDDVHKDASSIRTPWVVTAMFVGVYYILAVRFGVLGDAAQVFLKF